MELIPWLAIAAAFGSGFLTCRFTHRTKGIEVDEMHAPDFVPEDLLARR